MPGDGNEFQTVTISGYKGRSLSLNVLFEDINGDRFIRLSILPSKLRAYIEYEIINLEYEPTVEEIIETLTDFEISYGVEQENIEMFLRLLKQSDGKFGPFEIATGDYPTKGNDGIIDFLVRPSSQEAEYKSDDMGNVDYHETCLIENAYKGHTIAVILKPTRGTPGKDVYGNVIEAKPGEPITVKIGDNVSFEQKTGKCSADIDGRVVFEDDTIYVSDVYEVRGDVDLSVGNINFVGEVIIRGDITGDFSIYGKRRVYIEGRSGPAKISSEGNVFIRGGIAGNGENTIVTSEKGVFRTKYIDNCRVEANKGVMVRNEIINSTILTGGMVSIPRGAIMGGNVVTLKGIDAGTAGSELGVVTQIGSGQDWTKEDKISFFSEKLEMVNTLLDELAVNLGPLAEDLNAVKLLTGKKRNTVIAAIEKLKVLKDKKLELESEIGVLEDEKNEEAVYQININKTLYPGVVLKIGPLMEQVKDTRNGPLSVVHDPNGEFIRIGTQASIKNDIENIEYPY